jgi:hypothetical protein
MGAEEESSMIFHDETEPWLKARICKSALKQSRTNTAAGLVALMTADGWDVLKRAAEMRMREVDSLPAEWRTYVHEHGLQAARRAMKEYKGKTGVAKALVLGGVRLDLLDL